MSSKPAGSQSRRPRPTPTPTTSSIPDAACSRAGYRSSAVGGRPPLQQRPRLAIDRVAARQPDCADIAPRPLALLRSGPAHIRALAAGVGADDEQVRARALVLVGHTGRD